jgi:hypothetical protein
MRVLFDRTNGEINEEPAAMKAQILAKASKDVPVIQQD